MKADRVGVYGRPSDLDAAQQQLSTVANCRSMQNGRIDFKDAPSIRRDTSSSSPPASEEDGGGSRRTDRSPSSSTSSSMLRMDQERRLRREIANSNERRRMQSINAGFQTLRSLLPKKGVKMSKAAILQQAADHLRDVDAQRVVLLKQLAKCRKLSGDGMQMTAPPPTKKRVKSARGDQPLAEDNHHTTAVIDSAVVDSSKVDKSSVGIQADDCATAAEVEILKRRLIELQVALDHERQRNNLMRGEQYMALPHIGTLNSSSHHHHHHNHVPLLDYASVNQHSSVGTAPKTTSGQQQPPTQQILGIQLNRDLISPCPTSQAMMFSPFSPLQPPPPPLYHSQHAQQLIRADNQQNFQSKAALWSSPPPSLPPQQNATSAMAANGAESAKPPAKQNLNAILEAIRQLEGEELFLTKCQARSSFVAATNDATAAAPAAATTKERSSDGDVMFNRCGRAGGTHCDMPAIAS